MLHEHTITVVNTSDGSVNTQWSNFFKKSFGTVCLPSQLNKELKKYNARAIVDIPYKIELIFETREDAIAFNLIWT